MPTTAALRIRVAGLIITLLGLGELGCMDSDPHGRLPVPVLVDLAENAFAHGRPEEARLLLMRALSLDPDHPAAIRVLRQHWSTLSRAPTQQELEAVGRDMRLADAKRFVLQAEELVQVGALESALQQFEAAAVLMEPVSPPSDTQAVRQRILTISQQMAHQRRSGSADARRSALDEAQERSRITVSSTNTVLAERIRRIEDLESKGFYEVALSQLRVLVRDHPHQEQVRTLFGRVLAKAHAARNLSIAESHHELRQEIQERLERSLIPTTGYPGLFPDDWHSRHLAPPDLIALPDSTLSDQMQERLLARISLAVADTDVLDVLQAISRSHHINVVTSADFQRSRPRITLRVTEMSVRSVFDWIAQQIGTPWTTINGAVYFGDEATDLPLLRTYDLSEMSFIITDQIPRYRLGIYGPDQSQPSTTADTGSFLAPEDLVDTLMQAVAPATWQRADCSIQIRNNRLFVTAPVGVQRLIEQFLRSHMSMSRVMVHVEAKWLQHDDGFLEEIGVRWNGGGPLLTLPNGATSGFHRGTSGFDLNGSLTNNLPSVATPTPTPNAGLAFGSIILSSLQLSATVTAVEQNRRATLLNASELHTFNGVRANALFMWTHYYVSSLEFDGDLGNGLVAPPSPGFSVLLLGTQLDVKPFVSADRKYVTLDVASSRLTLEDILSEDVTFQTSLPVGQEPDPNTPGGPPIPIVVSGTSTARVDLPRTKLTEVRTTVMIPDGGSILVGGISEEVEQSVSAKVPFLGHIPFLGRLFGERGRYSTRTRTSLIFTVHVLDYAELEQRQ